MKKYLKLTAAAAFGVGSLVLTATTASAAVVCNGAGECWHTHRAYVYPATVGVVVHPNGWAWGPNEHYAWREHPGRGYWRNGIWIKL